MVSSTTEHPGPPATSGLVVCGTDTDVGKTLVSALLVQGLGAQYWKPVQCGLEGGGDRDRVQQLLQLPDERFLPEAYRFEQPVSPHWAAERSGVTVRTEQLEIPSHPGLLVVETAGGVMVPLRRDWLQVDQLARWRWPVLLVARSGLGTLNHTLLTLEALRRRGIVVLGLLLNGLPHEDNPRTLEAMGQVPLLGTLPPLPSLHRSALEEQWQQLNLASRLLPWLRATS
ncbi:dethiobiotin synthase [Synechococcus sp. RSCCF101]|uniref:dethiobiotin synthase n=1 Tax=Synechococcus sp. RSCCF101 TaxID=2511069 RepID=UPI0012456447|nr:dethiobiotin synthase [Synechococcus sp. RSCCF101]QEY33555.1 dethiobiotin synthase [Synechococcus sp. RSCCF101]